MAKPTVVIRADGNSTIGMGHYVRSLALAEMLKQDFRCVFATQAPTQQQQQNIDAVCSERWDLPNSQEHFNAFFQHLNGSEIVVLDNYYYHTQFQQQLKDKGCKLICIDDIHQQHFVADVVINHAEGIHPEAYSIDPNTRLHLGYQYALLRKPFLDSITNDATIEHFDYDCLLMLGATDPKGLLPRMLELLSETSVGKNLPIAVVGGRHDLQKSLGKQPEQVVFFDHQDAKGMVKLMRTAQFGFLPASTLSMEACATRLPIICGYFVDNQVECYEGLRDSSLVIGIENMETLQIEPLKQAVNRIQQPAIRAQLQQAQRNKLDTHIQSRYLQLFQELCH